MATRLAQKLKWGGLTTAFLGRIAATLFIAVCAALGFGPELWARMILGIEPSSVARSTFLALALATFAMLNWSIRESIHSGGDRTISLRDASVAVFESLRENNTLFSTNQIYREAEGTLNRTGQYLIRVAAIEAKRPPDEKWEPVSEAELNELYVSRGATVLVDGAGAIRRTEPRLKESDVRHFIRQHR